MKAIALFVLFACYLLPARASTDYLLKGTIGTSPVILSLEVSGGAVTGTYFYRKTCIDISFTGIADRNSFTLTTLEEGMDEESAELFQLTRSDDRFRGTWRHKGKTLAVLLSVVPEAEVKDPYAVNKQLEPVGDYPYQVMKRMQIRFERMDSLTTINGVTFRWIREPVFNSVFPRAVKGLPMTTMGYINDVLEMHQVANFMSYSTCDDRGNYGGSVNQLYVDSAFFSVQLWIYYACDHARPDDIVNNYNYDLRGQKELEVEDLLQFPGMVRKEDVDFDTYSGYQTVIFSKHLHDYFKTAHSEYYQEVSEEDGAECNYNDSTIWAFSDVLITKDGLLVEPYFPNYLKHCNNPEWSVLPFKAFQQYLNPEYKKRLLWVR